MEKVHAVAAQDQRLSLSVRVSWSGGNSGRKTRASQLLGTRNLGGSLRANLGRRKEEKSFQKGAMFVSQSKSCSLSCPSERETERRKRKS